MMPSMVDIRERGTITEITRGVVTLTGLPSCALGQVLDLTPRTQGWVVGFTETHVMAVTLGPPIDLAVGQTVEVRQQPLRLPVGTGWLGRALSPLGQPLDGEPLPIIEAERPLFGPAPGIQDREPISRQLCTGTRAIDTMIPVGRGQRELIIGDRMTGKTALAVTAMLSQCGQDVVSIYCLIGQPHHKLQHTLERLEAGGVRSQMIVVAATAAQEASEQFLAPYAAAALGEHFMAQGRDVLVVFDDLTKHAWAYRQLSLLLERPPGREAYPGDMFYMHSQLMERAAQLSPSRGGGSMTFLPICETQQGDVTGFICSNLISMTDGQLYLSSELFYEGMKPAIDAGLSVSRIGHHVQSPLLRAVASPLRLELVQHQELLRLSRFSAALSDDTQRRLHRGQLLRQLMVQPAHTSMPLAAQSLLFYALQAGWLERLDARGLDVCRTDLFDRLPPEVAAELAAHDAVTPLLRARLDAVLADVLTPFLTKEPSRDALGEAPAR